MCVKTGFVVIFNFPQLVLPLQKGTGVFNTPSRIHTGPTEMKKNKYPSVCISIHTCSFFLFQEVQVKYGLTDHTTLAVASLTK